ncbi:MAG: TetR/AcrR family transcriptional regulator [Rubrivivax sp.]|nr:TetR/AcrR family transcriptional regulator [Pyrinomonadaceae bacterium]
MKSGNLTGRRGRPRAFDTAEALDQAMQVFWEKGYEGASLADLTESMGVNRPSLYAAFGGKEELFRKVLDRYDEGPSSFVREALEEPNARAVVQRLLHGAAEMHTDPRTPRGCLMVHGALSSGAGADSIRRELNARRAAAETVLRKRLVRAKADGDLPTDANPADLARYVMTIVRGMAVQATGGASRAELLRVVRMALRAWPE